ncbi:hypothetical protein HYV50_05450 [Candidatus Pacearchaeota archaeon]|nr:hypothetical protein [Candidatus Pacearchaeota archaeon]
MKKRERKLFIYNVAFFQILLLVGMSFSVAFVMSDYVGFANGAEGTSLSLRPQANDYALGQVNQPTNTPIPTGSGSGAAKTAAAQAGAATTPAAGGFFSNLFFGKAFSGGAVGALTSGLIWGGVVYGGIKIIGKLFGLDEGLVDSLSTAAGVGTGVGTSLYFLGQNYPSTAWASFTPGISALVGIGVGVGIFLATYKKEKREIVKFECLPWEPPVGGSDCEKCNNNPDMPCSEYRCKSLGQACDIVNKGTTEEKCVWINKGDTQAPKIEPWEEALKPTGLRYAPDTGISPPNRGFRILSQQGCLDAFTKLEFGVTTDEPAQCRIDYEARSKYDEMSYLFGETNLFLEEHTQRLKVPNPFEQGIGAGDVPDIYNDGSYKLYVRCMDANGNGQDSAVVAFSFCVNPGPDAKQPIIEGTSIESGKPVSFDIDKVPIEVYVNEPAECKWSRQDKAYDVMENTMNCATGTLQFNADLNYVCSGELTGIKNRENNNFYFRCKDQPGKPESQRNVMTTSFPLTLRGTQELIITKVGPNATIQGSTSVVTVNLTAETAFGAEDGKATCYIDDEINGDFRLAMQGEKTNRHDQPLDLVAGTYTFYFKCVDAGANLAEDSTTFTVVSDFQAPKIVRVFRDGQTLKIITDEKARCSYSTTSCTYNFEDGTAMTYENVADKNVHYADWSRDVTYYIKCEDLQGNKPGPSQCQIVARGSEF